MKNAGLTEFTGASVRLPVSKAILSDNLRIAQPVDVVTAAFGKVNWQLYSIS